jgi:hypothetical protein
MILAKESSKISLSVESERNTQECDVAIPKAKLYRE